LALLNGAVLAASGASLLPFCAQREYRLYRRRQACWNRRNQRLARQAQAFLDVFLLQELTSLVPVCLLDVLRETRLQVKSAVHVEDRCTHAATCSSAAGMQRAAAVARLVTSAWRSAIIISPLSDLRTQEAATTKRREDLAASLAEGVLTPLIDECIRDAFHGVLQAMVKSYLVERIDLSRAATPTADAVAADILNDWTKELAAELLPEGRKAIQVLFSDCWPLTANLVQLRSAGRVSIRVLRPATRRAGLGRTAPQRTPVRSCSFHSRQHTCH
jgi:hypothetical protein